MRMRCDIKALHATSKNDIPAVKEPSVGLIQADSKRPYGVTLKPLKDERCRRHGTSQWPTDICAHYDRTVTSQTADTAAEAVHLTFLYLTTHRLQSMQKLWVTLTPTVAIWVQLSCARPG